MTTRGFGKIGKIIVNVFRKFILITFHIRLKLVRPHNFLRRNINWYHRWHNHKYHKHVHVSVLALYISLTLLSLVGLPQQTLAANGSWDFGAGVNGSGDANIDTSGGNVKLKQNWWNTAYGKRQLATVNTTDAVASGYSAKADIDMETLRAAGSVNNDLSDLRTVAKNRSTGALTELDRDIVKGQGANLNGSSQYVDVGLNSSLNLTTAFTIEAWIKTSSTQRGGIFDKLESGGSYNGYTFEYSNKYNGRLGFYSPSMGWKASNTALNDNNWHHVVVRGSSAGGYFYVDGQADGSFTFANLTTNAISAKIGKDYNNSYFLGQVDDVRVSNSVRYTAYFAPQHTPFTPDSNTKGLWHLDNDAGDDSYLADNG